MNSSKRIPMKEWRCKDATSYSKISQVGEGTFGKVYKAQDKSQQNPRLVALKKVLIENEKDGFPITAIREIRIMKRLNHNNVLRLNMILYIIFLYASQKYFHNLLFEKESKFFPYLN